MPRVNVKDKRKQQLIDANIASIAKRGLSETTIAHVSKGAGMSRGIVNFYFNTKEAMMQETCQHLADDYTAAWQRALEKQAEGTAEEKLQAVVAAHFQPSLCNQKKLAVWVAFWGHASSHAPYRKVVAEAHEAFKSAISQLLSEAKALQGDVTQHAYELHALICGSWLNFLLTASASDRDVLAEKCQAYVSRMLDAAPIGREASNVTELKPAEGKKGKKAAAKPKDEAPVLQEDAALGDLFAMR